jgi:hypothetical protein
MRILIRLRIAKSRVETQPGQAVCTWFGWRSKHRTINAQARLSKRLRVEASPAASEWSSDHQEESRGSRGIEDLLSEGSLASRLR